MDELVRDGEHARRCESMFNEALPSDDQAECSKYKP